MSKDSSNNPERLNASRWNQCAENALIKTGTGMLTGGLLSFLLLRSGNARAMATSFGAGVGAGIAWMDCRLLFSDSSIKLKTLRFSDLSSGGTSKSPVQSTTAPTPEPPSDAPPSDNETGKGSN